MRFVKKTLAENLFVIILTAFLLAMPVLSFAQSTIINVNPINTNTEGKIVNPLGADGPNNIQALIQIFLEGALKIGIPIVALAIIYSGFLFVSAMGNSDKLEKAKNTLLYTLIGAAILLGSWAIAKLISETVLAL